MSQDRPASNESTPGVDPRDTFLRRAGVEAASDLIAFVDRSPTPFHAAAEVARRLEARGFAPLDESEVWAVRPGDCRYVVRGETTVVAFVVGQESPAVAGFRMLGAHTDSPTLRVKPNPDVTSRGYRQLAVEVYGGVLLSTWLDRDLSVAGRVVLRNSSGRLEHVLVRVDRPVARISNLAIHLNRGVNTDGLVLNPQRHMVPAVGLGTDGSLRALLASEIGQGTSPESILSFDLSLFDTQGGRIGGTDDEFVFSPRLDNLASCHAGTEALTACLAPAPFTRVIALYDHEECGSRSAQGAFSPVLRDVLGRIVEAHPQSHAQGFQRAMARSLLVSADMAHAVHPNYGDQHEPGHTPVLNQGLVIKSNFNQAYATEGATAAIFEGFCREVGYAPQRFVTRSDLPCGSTIGPITAAELGVRAVDVGAPMLSMHSCREMCGSRDVHLAIETYKRLFTQG